MEKEIKITTTIAGIKQTFPAKQLKYSGNVYRDEHNRLWTKETKCVDSDGKIRWNVWHHLDFSKIDKTARIHLCDKKNYVKFNR